MKEKKQEKYDRAYLRMTLEWAKLSHCKKKQVGALIVKNGMIISDGYNGTPSGFDNCCEDINQKTYWYVFTCRQHAILKTAKSNHNCSEATLYLTMSPCKDCSKLILQSGIIRVVYLEEYKDISGVQFLKEAGVNILKFDKEKRNENISTNNLRTFDLFWNRYRKY